MPFTIVGVTPERLFGPDVGRVFDVAIPLGTEPLVRPRNHALDGRSRCRVLDRRSYAYMPRIFVTVATRLMATTYAAVRMSVL
jgi:hypothetical protein